MAFSSNINEVSISIPVSKIHHILLALKDASERLEEGTNQIDHCIKFLETYKLSFYEEGH